MDDNNASVTLLAVKVIAQIGILLVVIVGGAVLVGLLLDELLGTKPAFIFVLLLGSIPLTLWTIYRYTQHQTKQILASQKEDKLQ